MEESITICRQVNLHCHSSASIGASGTPAEIAAFLKTQGNAAFSLTEHDSLASLTAAQEASYNEGVEYVPGVELSTRVEDGPEKEVHILGYLFCQTSALKSLVEDAARPWKYCVDISLAKLRARGVQIELADIEEEIRTKFPVDDHWKTPYCVIPLHYVLQKRGLLARGRPVRDFLNELCPASKLPPLPSVSTVSRVLGEAGAVRILAHPGASRTPSDAECQRLKWWLDRYVDGLEVYTRKNSASYQDMMLELLKVRGRPATGGTDSHGYGDKFPISKIPYECLETLREFKGSQ